MKRFTETTKWDDPWYIDLSAEAKTFWEYLRDKCDNAGVIDLSHRQALFLLNGSKSIDDLIKEIGGRITVLKNGKLLIEGFVNFQYGQLSEASNLHKNIINTLKKHNLYDDKTKGILTLNEGLGKGTSKGKGKGKGKGEGKSNEEEEPKKDVYRSFKHLSISNEDVEKLKKDYSIKQIDDILDSIENYKPNKNYTSLFVTAKNWLKKDSGTKPKSPHHNVLPNADYDEKF